MARTVIGKSRVKAGQSATSDIVDAPIVADQFTNSVAVMNKQTARVATHDVADSGADNPAPASDAVPDACRKRDVTTERGRTVNGSGAVPDTQIDHEDSEPGTATEVGMTEQLAHR